MRRTPFEVFAPGRRGLKTHGSQGKVRAADCPMSTHNDQPAMRAFPWLPWVFNPRRPGVTTWRGMAGRRGRLAVLACVAGWLWAGAAWSQPAPGEAGFDQGRALRAAHRDEEALAVFRRLYEATHEPRALAQIALAEGALGQWVTAEEHLLAALASPDGWVTRHRALLTGARDEIATHVGDLVVACETPGSELWIDGRRVASLPLARPLRVVAGTATVEVRAAGYVTAARSVSIAAGGLAREPVSLVAVAPVPVVAVVTPPPVVVVTPPPVVHRPVVVAPPALPPRPAPSSGRRTAAWATAAGAVVLGATAGVLYGLGRGAVADYNESPENCPGLNDEPPIGTCATILDRAYGLRVAAIVSLVGAVGSAAASTVLFATTPRASGPRIACGGGPGTIGIACAAGF